jgi:hypothetical protein
MKFTLLLPLLVLVCMVFISLAILESTLLPGIAEMIRPVLHTERPLYIPSSKIGQSTVAPTLVKEVVDWYPAALKYAPALPTPSQRDSKFRKDPL